MKLSTVSGLSLAVLAGCSVLSLTASISGCARASQAIEELEAAQGTVASFEAASELAHAASVYGDALSNIEATTEEEYLQEASDKIYEALQSTFAGCVTPYPEDSDPRTVGASFSCSGENGLFTITGTLEGTLTPVMEGLKVVGSQLALTTTDLVVSNRTLQGTIDVEYTIATNLADLSLDFDATDSNVGTVTLLVNGTVAPVQSCLTFDGAIATEGEKFTSDVQVTGFERCEGSCPSAGGSAVASITDDEGAATLTITFDGSSQAAVSSSRGKNFDVPLTCGQ